MREKICSVLECAPLSDRQITLLELLSVGMTPDAIIERMNVSRRVYDALRRAALRKIKQT